MRKTLTFLMAALLIPSWGLAQKATLEVQTTTASDLNLYVLDEGSIELSFKEDGDDLYTSGDIVFWWATNGIRSEATVNITNNIPSSTNVYSLPYTASDFTLDSPGTRPWAYGVEVGGKMLGDGNLYVKHRTGFTNSLPTFLETLYLDYCQITQYYGVAECGPYDFGSDFLWTTNANGSIALEIAGGSVDTIARAGVASNAADIAVLETVKVDVATLDDYSTTTDIASTYAPISEPIWSAVSNTVTAGAALGASSTQPADLAAYLPLAGSPTATPVVGKFYIGRDKNGNFSFAPGFGYGLLKGAEGLDNNNFYGYALDCDYANKRVALRIDFAEPTQNAEIPIYFYPFPYSTRYINWAGFSMTNIGTITATAFIGDGSGLTGLPSGSGSGFPLTNDVSFADFGATSVGYMSYSTNSAAVAPVANELVEYVKDDRKWFVYGGVTNYMELD